MPSQPHVQETPQAFQPFVPPTETRPELTTRALVLGCIFGLLFGAVTVYVGFRAGLTVGASIPIAVLSISLLRAFGRASILENNIVQTTGNSGQSIASGVIFTLPALIFLGFNLQYSRIFVLALLGGLLGVLFMIPLRRQLIVAEHGRLTCPEGTACADVLLAGERGGFFAGRVFLGLGLGGIYTLFQNDNLFAAWPGTPDYQPKWLKGAAIRADVTPEYLGVGYIIGPRVAGVIFAGGVFSWLVVMPLIYFFGSHMPDAIYPGTKPVSMMSPSDLWASYIRPMGAGAVAASGLITLLKTMPTIVGALRSGAKEFGKGASKTAALRTDRDLPMSVVIFGSAALVLLMFFFLTFHPVPGAQTTLLSNFAAAFLVVIFGFLFVTVASRIVGLIGSSASPVSGMTIATLMATTAIFLVKGWTAPAFGALAITIGGVVCVAASNAGDTSQDLKTGYLIGATPWKQQIAIMIGVIISIFSIGATLNAMNKGLETFQRLPKPIVFSLAHLPDGVQNSGNFNGNDRITLVSRGTDSHAREEITNAKQYILLNSIGSTTLDDGKYLYNPTTGEIEIQWIQGIGSEKAAAPQGRLMATVINGILSRKLPWTLVLLGVFIVIVVELLGVRSLTFAVGAYLSIATTLAIFVGGVARWMVDYAMRRHSARQAQIDHDASLALWHSDRESWLAQHPDFDPTNPAHADDGGVPVFNTITARDVTLESEVSPGSLYASGLIAAGGIVGLLRVWVKLYEAATDPSTPRFSDHNPLHNDMVSVIMFALLAFSLYYFARKPLGNSEEK